MANLLGSKLQIRSSRVLLEVLDRSCARNRDHLLPLGENPRKADLGRSDIVLLRHGLDFGYELENLGEILARIFGNHTEEALLGKIVVRAEISGEQAAADRAIGDDGDAELAARPQNVVLRGLNVEAEKTVLYLDSRDGMHGVRAANVVGGDLGKSEVADLALPFWYIG